MSRRVILATIGALLAAVALSWLLPKLHYVRLQGNVVEREEGRPVRGGPQRVICLSPAVAEIVFALDQGERVVGVSEYTTYPPEALTKPVCGGFFNPNFELVVSLRPDLIITEGKAEKVSQFARDQGIKHLSLQLMDLESIFTCIREAGRALDCEEEAQVLCARLRLRLAEVELAARDRPRRRVLIVLGRERGSLRSIYTTGPDSFAGDVLELAGGDNVFGDVTGSYVGVSKEALILRQPEVIIELQGEGILDDAGLRRIKTLWSDMPGLPAVRDERIYAVGDTYAVIPGPRVVDLAERLAGILHQAEER